MSESPDDRREIHGKTKFAVGDTCWTVEFIRLDEKNLVIHFPVEGKIHAIRPCWDVDGQLPESKTWYVVDIGDGRAITATGEELLNNKAQAIANCMAGNQPVLDWIAPTGTRSAGDAAPLTTEAPKPREEPPAS